MFSFAAHTLVIARIADVERRARFIEQATRLGLGGWAFFDAIDGPGMGLETRRPSTFGRANRPSPDPISPGEIGCLLSHLAIWRMAVALDLDEVCVLEDDVDLDDDIAEQWRAFVHAAPRDWLMLHAGGDEVAPELEPVPVNEHAARVRQSYGTRLMLLEREALRMLAEMPVTLGEPADWAIRPLFDTGRVYCPVRPLVRHRNDPGGMP